MASLFNNSDFKNLREREVVAQEKKTAAEIGLVRAQTQRTQNENIFNVLLQRKQLLDAGVAQEDVDKHLPVPSRDGSE